MRGIVRAGTRGLVPVLVGPASAGAPRWRTGWHRRAAYAVLAVLTPLVGWLSLTSVPSEVTASWLFAIAARRSSPPQPQVTVVGADWAHGQYNRSVIVSASGPLRPVTLLALAMLTALVMAATLPLLARYPLLGWRIGWLGLLLVPLLHVPWSGGWPWDPVQVPLLVAAFAVAGVGVRRSALWWMWALSLGAWWLWVLRAHHLGPLTGALGTAAFTALTVAVDALGTRRRAQRARAERAEWERARLTVLEERTRIARELHDVVAHHMALIAVRAESAPFRLGELPAPVQEEFAWLSGTAREAMADMRRLLALLRQEDRTAERAPQPDLTQVPLLVEAAQRAGVPVELSMPAQPERVPDGVGVCAYRIVQESLSNALRHAPGAPVQVRIDRDGEGMALRVTNGPGRTNGQDPRTGGHGLAGMRERAALLGGSLLASPAPDGGFVVSAVLPLP